MTTPGFKYRSMLPNDEMITRGIVGEKITEGDAIRLLLEVWCENQYGKKVIVGKSSGIVT